MEIKGDLHLHTVCSDASSTPENLIRYVKAQGLSFAAVTDHDTMAGVGRAIAAGNELGITVIPGVEWSCVDGQRGNRKVHLLSYFLTLTPALQQLSRQILERRKKANMEAFHKLKTLFPVTEEMLDPIVGESTVLYKQHMMRLLMDMGYIDRVYPPLYSELFSSKGGSCFVPMEYPDVRDVIPIIWEAGGLCVVAHAMAYKNLPLVEELAEKNMMDGVEILHPSHSEADRALLLDLAEKHHLCTTGGTDFHGMHREKPELTGTCFTTEKDFLALKTRKNEKIGQNPLV